MRIERVQLDEQTLAIIEALDEAVFPEHPTSNKAGLGWEWWLAWDENNQPVAFAATWIDGDTGRFEKCGVLKQARGDGLQRKLIEAREADMRARGISRIITYTAPHNWPSNNNLIKLGFVTWLPYHDDEYFDGYGWIYWTKSLEDPRTID
jgi:ribosomal protein S18 acetylase RimI-like enzyme